MSFDFEIITANSLSEIDSAINFVVEHQMRRYNVPTTKQEILNEDAEREVYWFLAKRLGEIIGVSSAKIWHEHRHHVGVHYWVVMETERGNGVGRALLEKIYEIARLKHEPMVFAALRPVATIAYEACGFKRIDDMEEIPYKGMQLIPYEYKVS